MSTLKTGLCILTGVWLLACGSDSPSSSTAPTSDAGDKSAKRQDSTQTSDSKIGQGANATDCDRLDCNQPAECVVRDRTAHCVCPDGYRDLDGDGRKCEDIDECIPDNADAGSACGKHATCKNTPGAFECECRGPAYERAADNVKACKCADGFVARDGDCIGPDGAACEDNLDCESGHCVSAICCAQACAAPPDDCHTDEGATCNDGRTCKYKAAKDGASCEDGDACTQASVCKGGKCQRGSETRSCDDNNQCTDDSCDSKLGCKNENNTQGCDDRNKCTSEDKCQAGVCTGESSVDCSAASDACNEGVCAPADGTCKKRPRKDGATCDDTNSCTTSDVCTAGGCQGKADACGKNATSCTPGAPGTSNTCACAASFHAAAGRCVPDNDECTANTCGANADCLDQSNAVGDYTCTCKAGFAGDAKSGCAAVDPCANNPCGEGRGTCTATADGKHSCSCEAGLREVLGQCVCDVGGTFAVRRHMQLSWTAASPLEAGDGETYSWSIERHNYTPDGILRMEMVSCGETNLDLCGAGLAVARVPAEAYAQYVPVNVWGKQGVASTHVETALTSPFVNGRFEVPNFAVLQGISLADPLGAWPPTRQDIQGMSSFDGSAVNDARWLDTDSDGVLGLTTFAVGPGGINADGSDTAPIAGYGTHSIACPRGRPDAERLPYNYPPAAEGLTVRRVKRFSSANRQIYAYNGTMRSCDRIEGDVTGPDSGAIHFDTRIGACVRVDGNDEIACSGGIIDFLDMTAPPSYSFRSNTFVMIRVPDATTCAGVRALSF